MSQKIDIRERRYNGVDYDILHPETNINMVLDSSSNSVGDINGALYGDGNGNIVGATISNPNLLDNPWFTVNQRGQSSYSANGNTVDRWEKTVEYLTVSAVTSGLLFTKTSGRYGYFQQKISRVIDEDATYTLSLKDNSGNIYTLTAQFIATTSAQKYIVINGVEVGLGLFGKGATPYVAIAFPTAASGNFTLRAIKLELGSVSTLANDVAPNYDIELLKCQGYMGGFLNAASHNAVYRGKNLGTSVTAEQYAAIAAGTFDDLYIGDYWVINGVNWRIAAFDYYLTTGDTECTTHHVTIVPDTNLDSQKMNDSNTTTGGYAGSAMYTANMATAKNTIKTAFGSLHILNHRQFLCNAVTNGKPSGGAWFDSEIELMTEQNVYGGKVFGAGNDGSTVPALYTIDKSQFPLFAYAPHLQSNRQTYWLRDVVSALYFADVNSLGYANDDNASVARGVRPAFSIKA